MFCEDEDYENIDNIPIGDRDIRMYPVEKIDINQEMKKRRQSGIKNIYKHLQVLNLILKIKRTWK